MTLAAFLLFVVSSEIIFAASWCFARLFPRATYHYEAIYEGAPGHRTVRDFVLVADRPPLRHYHSGGLVGPGKSVPQIITCELRIDGTRFRAGLTESQRVIDAFRKTQGGG